MSPAPAGPTPLWTPDPHTAASSVLGRFGAWVASTGRSEGGDYDDLWRWSVRDLEGFWRAVWEWSDIQADGDPSRVLTDRSMPGASWFPDVSLNYAEHALRWARDGDPHATAVIARSQTRDPSELTWLELWELVARVRTGLLDLGVGPGDRVGAYLPNIPETLAAFLATASLGAIWSSCAPEFGTAAVLDRLGQIQPKVLLAVDGYRYGRHVVDRRDEARELGDALGSTTVLLPYAFDPSAEGAGRTWDDLIGARDPEPLTFVRVPFDHPLYVLYSSGTTGLPKAIVHGHGGILLEHHKSLGLHLDLGARDRFFWFSTTGWMMWNYLVSGLLVNAAVVCYDGNPGYPDTGALWDLVAETRTTYAGVSAPYLMACRKAGLRPGDTLDLTALRGVGSTGSPLPPEGFEWVYEAVGSALELGSLSGGTDICTALVGSSPMHPVWPGEIACRCLGVAAAAFGPDGGELPAGVEGELVVTEPMPSMPVGFWGPGGDARYAEAYFSRFSGVWSHGDWITFTDRGSCVIGGRSDATLNRGGVRSGTAEYYAVVEALPEVADSLIVHLEDAEGPGELLLFVVPAAGHEVDDALVAAISDALRTRLSPRHVPDRVVGVSAVPRTLSGKKLEIPVKRILRGEQPDAVASVDALADPGSLDEYLALSGDLTAR
jgi:acetoacetyl-CoA synthetase